jgi:hypothetical protein
MGDDMATHIAIALSSGERGTFELSQKYVFQKDGTVSPLKVAGETPSHPGALYSKSPGATDQLVKTAKTLQTAGNIFTAIIIVKDIKNLGDHWNDANPNNPQKLKAEGTLIIDATGAIIGYANPVTGVFWGVGLYIMTTPEYRAAMVQQAIAHLDRLREKHSMENGKLDYYMWATDPETEDWMRVLEIYGGSAEKDKNSEPHYELKPGRK